MFGAESVNQTPSSDWRVHRLPMHVGTFVVDLDGEAVEEDRSDGNGRNSTLSNDIRTQSENARVG